MNRRFFLKAIGSSILGAAIALKIPETLIPRIAEIKDRNSYITFEMLDDSYNKAMLGTKEPDFFIVNRGQLREIENMMKPYLKYENTKTGETGIKYRNAVILSREEDREPEEISTGHLHLNGYSLTGEPRYITHITNA